MKKTAIILFALVLSTGLFAQVLTPEMQKRMYKDTFLDYDPELDIDSVRNFQQKSIVPYPPIREADVLWSKRIWREIEVAEKINLPLYYPLDQIQDRKNLYTVLTEAMMDGLIQAFDSRPVNGDEFVAPMDAEEAMKELFGVKTSITKMNEFGEPYEVDTINPFQPGDVTSYRLKEDWYFDKQRSELRVKILGIQPVCQFTDPDDGQVKTKPTAWFYFPEVRHVIVNYEVYNRENETKRITFDDIFFKRYFSSHIIKEDNVYNRQLGAVYKDPYTELLKAEEIKREIFNFEHDLWSY